MVDSWPVGLYALSTSVFFLVCISLTYFCLPVFSVFLVHLLFMEDDSGVVSLSIKPDLSYELSSIVYQQY